MSLTKQQTIDEGEEICSDNFEGKDFTIFFNKYEDLFDMIAEYRRCANSFFTCFRAASMKKITKRIVQWSEENEKDDVPLKIHAALILEHRLLQWCHNWSEEKEIDLIFNYVIDKYENFI